MSYILRRPGVLHLGPRKSTRALQTQDFVREQNSSDEMNGKSVRLGSCRLGFDSESGQTNDFKIGIHSFPA